MSDRFIEVTHIYVLRIPPELTESVDVAAQRGIQIMESFIKQRASEVSHMRSNWKHLPHDWEPRPETENVPRHEDLSVGEHPWDYDVWIFPEDHPLATLERAAKAQYDYRTLDEDERQKLKQTMLELGSG